MVLEQVSKLLYNDRLKLAFFANVYSVGLFVFF